MRKFIPRSTFKRGGTNSLDLASENSHWSALSSFADELRSVCGPRDLPAKNTYYSKNIPYYELSVWCKTYIYDLHAYNAVQKNMWAIDLHNGSILDEKIETCIFRSLFQNLSNGIYLKKIQKNTNKNANVFIFSLSRIDPKLLKFPF